MLATAVSASTASVLVDNQPAALVSTVAAVAPALGEAQPSPSGCCGAKNFSPRWNHKSRQVSSQDGYQPQNYATSGPGSASSGSEMDAGRCGVETDHTNASHTPPDRAACGGSGEPLKMWQLPETGDVLLRINPGGVIVGEEQAEQYRGELEKAGLLDKVAKAVVSFTTRWARLRRQYHSMMARLHRASALGRVTHLNIYYNAALNPDSEFGREFLAHVEEHLSDPALAPCGATRMQGATLNSKSSVAELRACYLASLSYNI